MNKQLKERLTGVLALLAIVFIFAPWLYNIAPPPSRKSNAIPKLSPVPNFAIPAPSLDRLPADTTLAADAILQDAVGAIPVDIIGTERDTNNIHSIDRTTKELLLGINAIETSPKIQAKSKSKSKSRSKSKSKSKAKSVPNTKPKANKPYYRVRLGVFKNPDPIMLRLSSAGYVAYKEIYSKRAKDLRELHAVFVGSLYDNKEEALVLAERVDHYYDLKSRVEIYRN